MSDLLQILQSKTGHRFVHGDMQVCQDWERIGFNYLDSLGLKWYDEPPPVVIEFREDVPSRDVFVRGNRGQWMFFWLCFYSWTNHGGYLRTVFNTDAPINAWFRWDSCIDQSIMLRMNSSYRRWRSA